jgi:hypothetical protein
MLSFIYSSNEGIAEDVFDKPYLTDRLEVPRDEYVPVPREEQEFSPAYQYMSADFFATQVNVNIGGDNIVGDAANEPSIAIDPTDPNKMVIGWRQFDTIYSDFRQAGYGYTADEGQTWTFPGVIDPGVFRSDPVLDYDARGNFYYNSLTSNGYDFTCKVFKSTNGGATWDSGTYAYGGDKQWMTIDKTGGIGDGNIYAYWTSVWSICYPGFFTRSTDGNNSYENCVTIPGDPSWGTLATGLDGELYVFGEGYSDFVMAKSTDARDAGGTVTWDFSRTVDLDGYLNMGGPNPDGLLGHAWIAVDHSTGPTSGYIYALASVDRSSTSDPCDVMFSRSTDGGSSWSSAIRVNDDPGNNAWQWFGTMSVAPNGRIDVIWLDTRNDPGGYDSALYYSYSLDAGFTWSDNERLSPFFDPHLGWPQQNKMGDYFDMISDERGAHLAWAATFNGEQDVYYGHISTARYVPGEYGTIQGAIDAAEDGNTIIVDPGTYVENIDFLGKSIQVVSQGGLSGTVIDGNFSGSVVTFDSGEDGTTVLDGFTIINGSAADGGGIYCSSSSPQIINNLITGCAATGYGSGIYAEGSSDPTVLHSTITGNSAGSSGGGIWSSATSITVINSIVWDNSAPAGPQIGLDTGDVLVISYSDVEGGEDGIPGGIVNWGLGMFAADPIFEDPGSGDYHLTSESPCVDAGKNSGVMDDFEGDRRPAGHGFDIGCDESPYSTAINLSLTLDGPAAVAVGDTLFFSSLIQNNSNNPISGEYWISILLPNMNEVLIPEAFLNFPNPMEGQIPANRSINPDYELYIPGMADTDTYTLIGRIGNYPGTVRDEESFDFDVVE